VNTQWMQKGDCGEDEQDRGMSAKVIRKEQQKNHKGAWCLQTNRKTKAPLTPKERGGKKRGRGTKLRGLEEEKEEGGTGGDGIRAMGGGGKLERGGDGRVKAGSRRTGTTIC